MPHRKQKPIDFFFKRFNSIEIITFAYTILSAIYILCFYRKIEDPLSLLSNRIGIVAGIFILSFWNSKNKATILEFARTIFPLILITYWYPETYYLNHGILVPNLDHLFDELDIWLFNCSPAMEFSRLIPYPWFSEIMYFAYFSFYLIYIYLICLYFFKYREHYHRITFTTLTCFLFFYIIFIFIPVEGPQFYWIYPDNQVPDGYLFSKLMRFTQDMGEKPTGAFPSSHVGMTLVYMCLLFKPKDERKAFWIILPTAILLFCSTVYIKAHYLIDVVAAFIFTPIIYRISQKLYNALTKRFPQLDYVKEHP